MQRSWVKVAIAVAALVIIVIGLIPFLINADTFRPKIEDQLSAALGRKVSLGHLSFSLLSGSLVAENISIADDPAFSTSPFIEAKSLHIGVRTTEFLLHRSLQITNFTVQAPSIHLIHAQNGTWNFSSLGGAAPQNPQQESTMPDLTVGELKLKNGSGTVSSLPATGKPFEFTGINLTIQQLSLAKSFPFQLSAKLPGGGTFDLSGNAGPLTRKNAADTPFNATLNLKQFDPVAAGVVDPGQGISMVLDIDAQLASNGTTLSSKGKIQAAKLQLARSGSPAPQPVHIDYAIVHTLDPRTGQVSDLSIHTGSVVAHVNGSYRLTARAILLDLSLSAPGLPIDQLEQLLPAVGVHLPTGSSLKGGTLAANLAVTGPATAVTIKGPVEIDNSQLVGFDLGSKIQGINPFGGKGGGTQIQTLRADVNSSPQATQLTNIVGNLPQIGSATGSGAVLPSGAIDFKMVAKFSSSSGVGAIAGQAVNQITNLVGSFLHPKRAPASNTNAGIPLTITGTTSNPSIRADLRAMLR